MSIFNVILLLVVVAVVAFTLAYFGSKRPKDYDKHTMHYTATCLVVASIIASTVSFAAVYIALSGKIDSTHQEVFIDILSILVTVLMGWNIISVVDFKNRAEKQENKVEKRLNRIDTLSSDIDHIVNGIMLLNMYSFPLRKDKATLIDSCFSSLEEIVKCEDSNINKAAIEQNMLLLLKIFKSFKKEIFIFEDRKNAYLYVLDQIARNKYKADIVQFINDARGVPSKESDVEFMFDNINKTVETSSSQDSKHGAFDTSNSDEGQNVTAERNGDE